MITNESPISNCPLFHYVKIIIKHTVIILVYYHLSHTHHLLHVPVMVDDAHKIIVAQQLFFTHRHP